MQPGESLAAPVPSRENAEEPTTNQKDRIHENENTESHPRPSH